LSGRTAALRGALGVMMMMAAMPRLRQLAVVDQAVAVGVELVEQRVGAGLIDAGIAERGLEFGFADLPVSVGVELGKKR